MPQGGLLFAKGQVLHWHGPFFQFRDYKAQHSKWQQPSPSLVSMTFGSGQIEAAIASDNVRVANRTARMTESLLLMVVRALNIQGPFEGILGLGLPGSVIGKGSKELAAFADLTSKAIRPLRTLGFLEKAQIPRFSICLKDGADGVLRLSQPRKEEAIGAIGRSHWALDFGGISVGDPTRASPFCSRATMRHGQKTACAAVPDSGTTVIMAPEDHLNLLFADLCKRWHRCRQAAWAYARTDDRADTESDHKNLSQAFQEVLLDCSSWVNTSHGLDQELPPIHFHFTGANGEKRAITLGGAGYVVETMQEEVHYVKQLLWGSLPIRLPVFTGHKAKVCTPAFGSYAYNTDLNGPVWILGLPIFYEYEVGYELTTQPPGISFSEGPCSSCSSSGFVEESSDPLSLVATRKVATGRARQPRLSKGPPRLPNININEPL
jgi:hypothetical protein